MKIGVISDTHIPINADNLPQELETYFKDVDMILHAGDLTELSVLENLAKLSPRVEAVSGNMDSKTIQSKLPEKMVIKAGNYSIGLVHGWGPPQGLIERISKIFKNVDIIVFGHSHKPICERRNNVLFFNPGSATDTVHASYRSIGILELNKEIKAKIIKF